jgi:hypothetical protein
MTDLSPARKQIQIEETKDQAAVSQSTASRIGQAVNFINTKHDYQHDWHINGPYNTTVAPKNGIDGLITYPHNFELTDVMLIVGEFNGTSGVTEIDIKWRPENGGVWTSVFTTTPKFTYLAAPFHTVRSGLVVANMTAPVLLKTVFDAHDQLRLDIIQQVDGTHEGLFAKAFLRPR